MSVLICVLLLLIVVLACLWTVLEKRRLNRLTANVPNFSGELPIIGHTFKLCDRSRDIVYFLRDISEEANKYGGLIKMWLGPKLIYGVTNPRIIKTLSNICLEKNMFYDFLKPCLGDGLIVSKGKTWKCHRKTMNSMFHRRLLEGFLPTLNDHATSLVNRLKQCVGKGEFNHWNHISAITLQIAYDVIFGLQGQRLVGTETYGHALDKVTESFTKRVQNVFLYPDFLYKYSGYKKEDEDNYKLMRDVNAAAYDLNLKLKNSNKSGDRFKPLLDSMLETVEKGVFTETDVQDEIENLMVAAYDTNATTLTYAMLAVGAYPDVQDKLVQELHDVFEDSSREITLKDLSRLVYMDAVVMETLRMFSVVPVVTRKVAKTVKVDNFVFPAGSDLLILLQGVNMREEWGKDFKSFNPNRFLNKPKDVISKIFYPFSVGKRDCIGKFYALMQLKVLLTHVLRKYRLKGSLDNLEVGFEIILRPRAGFHIAIDSR